MSIPSNLLLNMEFIKSADLPVSSRNPPASTFPALGLQAHPRDWTFCMGVADLRVPWVLGSYAFPGRTLPAQPFPQPPVTLTGGELPSPSRVHCPCCPCPIQNCHQETPLTGHQRSLQDPYSISAQQASWWVGISEDMACRLQPAVQRHGLLQQTQKEERG